MLNRLSQKIFNLTVGFVRFQVFITVTVKNAVLWDVTVFQLLVTANVVHSSLIISTLIMEAICSSETSALTIATGHEMPRDSILNTRFV
jgi:hypothetical protein